MNTIPTTTVRGITLCVEPAREPCFTVVQSDAGLHEYADMSEISRRERLHRHMNNEIGSLEIAAQMLVDFPDAPWELRMQLARQCWDESRHVTLLCNRLVELGGYKGEFPVSNFEWCLTNTFDHIVARLAVQNRTFEAGQMDILGKVTEAWREAGDALTADMLDGICADEIQHVRFANQWIRRLVAEDRRLLLRIASAMMALARANEAMAPAPGERNAVGTPISNPNERAFDVNVPDRIAAEFSEEEVHEVLRQAGFRSIIPAAVPA
jgi:hypothetical protein